MKRLYITADLHKVLKAIASLDGITLNQLVETILRSYANRRKGVKAK